MRVRVDMIVDVPDDWNTNDVEDALMEECEDSKLVIDDFVDIYEI